MHLETKETNLVNGPVAPLSVLVLRTIAPRLFVDLFVHVGDALIFCHKIRPVLMRIFDADCLPISSSALLPNQNPWGS